MTSKFLDDGTKQHVGDRRMTGGGPVSVDPVVEIRPLGT
jgi:hypothetical protein